MDSREVLLYLLETSGKTRSEASRELGRSRNFLNSTIFKQSTPRLDTIVEVANICGFDIAIIPRGKKPPKNSVIIEAPK